MILLKNINSAVSIFELVANYLPLGVVAFIAILPRDQRCDFESNA